MFKVSLRLFSAFAIFWQPCISKMAGRRAKRTENWDSGTLVTYLVVFKVMWGHLVHLYKNGP